MKPAFLTVLLVCASLPAWSITVYKSVDEAGNVQLSDTPRPGARKIEIGPSQVYSAAAAARSTPSTAVPAQAAEVQLRCSIDAPANDQVFTNVSQVEGRVTVAPSPQPDDLVTLLFDGVPQPGTAGGAFMLDVERGSHTLQLTVTDADGVERCHAAVTFNVRRDSVIAPAVPSAPGVVNPNRPRR